MKFITKRIIWEVLLKKCCASDKNWTCFSSFPSGKVHFSSGKVKVCGYKFDHGEQGSNEPFKKRKDVCWDFYENLDLLKPKQREIIQGNIIRYYFIKLQILFWMGTRVTVFYSLILKLIIIVAENQKKKI